MPYFLKNLQYFGWVGRAKVDIEIYDSHALMYIKKLPEGLVSNASYGVEYKMLYFSHTPRPDFE